MLAGILLRFGLQAFGTLKRRVCRIAAVCYWRGCSLKVFAPASRVYCCHGNGSEIGAHRGEWR
ncbi:hypothetical protein KCP76_22505 [Salmonella enterica subsp. enterica serovar Weltevreden]|nr:hypothetical protein KCP76_22505 [Salmonella enterica subsp. enterica serovar Weltevreden]